jgi:hypothetical protein
MIGLSGTLNPSEPMVMGEALDAMADKARTPLDALRSRDALTRDNIVNKQDN